MTAGSRLKILRFTTAALLASAGAAIAASSLTADDYRYLSSAYGLQRQSDVLANLTPVERSSLHDVISSLSDIPPQREEAVRDRLYRAYARECEDWARAHEQACRPAADQAAQPGKDIADRICSGCHLFGSGLAPSFFGISQKRQWDADAIDGALQHSHDMVPVKLSAEERERLAIYINSFK